MTEALEQGGSTAVAVVVLAAGVGRRMRSQLPKVLHEVGGVPMLEHVLRAADALEPRRLVVVVGHGAELVEARFRGRAEFARQEAPRGTADAVLAAAPLLDGWRGTLVVVNGDAVLVTGDSLRALAHGQHEGGPGMTLVSYVVDDPSGLGRIVRDEAGEVRAIVEERDADDATRSLREVNPGLYAFDGDVWSHLRQVGTDNAAGERYLTDVVVAYLAAGAAVRAVRATDEARLQVGVNDRSELAVAERLMRDRMRRRWLGAGVTFVDPPSTFIDIGVEIGPDAVLEPGVVLRGETRVGAGARIGAYAVLDDSVVTPRGVVAPHTVARSERLGGG